MTFECVKIMKKKKRNKYALYYYNKGNQIKSFPIHLSLLLGV